MIRRPVAVAFALAMAPLGACSDQEDEVAGSTDTTMPQGETDEAATNDAELDRQMAAMTGPFADAERSMSREMTAAVGVDAADTWTRKMIAHHRGAVEMSEAFLAQDGGSPEARDMAQRTIDKQTGEIAELEGLLKDGDAQQASARPYAAAEREMMQEMMAARSDDVTESFLRKMLAHHEGGVALSEVALEQGGDEPILARARATREDQAKEAEDVEKMLAG